MHSKVKILIAALLFLQVNCKKNSTIPRFTFQESMSAKPWEQFYDSMPRLRLLDKSHTYVIRVLRLTDPRLDDLSDQEYQQLYSSIEKFVFKYLGFQIKMIEKGESNLLHFMRANSEFYNLPHYKNYISQHFIDLNDVTGRSRTKGAILEELGYRGMKIIETYIEDPAIRNKKDKDEISEYFLNRFNDKYNHITHIVCKDGSILGEGDYLLAQHYTYWTPLLIENKDYDFFLSNSILVGADELMPIYVINRGGITSAVTENNLHNEMQGVIFQTLMPFISNDPFFREHRGEIPAEEKLNVIAMLVTHEFGHLLGRYREYYDLPDSPFNAPKDLRYYEWYKKIINNKTMPKNLEILDKY